MRGSPGADPPASREGVLPVDSSSSFLARRILTCSCAPADTVLFGH